MNNLKTVFLLGLMTGLLMLIGGGLGGRSGLIIAFGFAILMNFGTYWFSDRIVLAMYRAQEVSPAQDPELHSLVEGLAARASMPKPRVFRVPNQALNAFATGRNPQHAAVAVTDGLRHHLSREELEGVLAHEIAHIRNRDILISTVAATVAGAIMMLAHMARWAAIFGGFGGRDDDDGGGVLGLILTAVAGPKKLAFVLRGSEVLVSTPQAIIVSISPLAPSIIDKRTSVSSSPVGIS